MTSQDLLTDLQSGIDVVQANIDRYDAQIVDLRTALNELKETGVSPAVLESIIERIDQGMVLKAEAQETMAQLQAKLNELEGQEGLDLVTLISAVLVSLLGSPIVNRVVPNSFLTRGVVKESKG